MSTIHLFPGWKWCFESCVSCERLVWVFGVSVWCVCVCVYKYKIYLCTHMHVYTHENSQKIENISWKRTINLMKSTRLNPIKQTYTLCFKHSLLPRHTHTQNLQEEDKLEPYYCKHTLGQSLHHFKSEKLLMVILVSSAHVLANTDSPTHVHMAKCVDASACHESCTRVYKAEGLLDTTYNVTHN